MLSHAAVLRSTTEEGFRRVEADFCPSRRPRPRAGRAACPNNEKPRPICADLQVARRRITLRAVSKPIKLEAAIRTRLEEIVGPILFSDLRAHLDRDAVFVVADEIELVDCGVSVAMDDVKQVGAWIDGGQLRKPGTQERLNWAAIVGPAWLALVVQPYVLVQLLAKPN